MKLIPSARVFARCSRGSTAAELGIITVMVSTVLVFGLNSIADRLKVTFAAIDSASQTHLGARPQDTRAVKSADRED